MSSQTEDGDKPSTSQQQELIDEYERFGDFVENVRKTYEKLYRELVLPINDAHLQPFTKIPLEKRGILIKNSNALIESLRERLLKHLLTTWNDFWVNGGVSESLILLQMYKEKCKRYEGKNWKMWSKTPLERTRPIRMRLNENRIHYLEAQLQCQRQQLKEALENNAEHRKKVEEITIQRTLLTKAMENYEEKFELDKLKILRLQQDLLSFDNESTTIETEKK
uniref:Uncharacterized protein n=1 Tax=Glossina brevipalpis TaxID=37001 RepID=A0A1A9WNX0_9MUSC